MKIITPTEFKLGLKEYLIDKYHEPGTLSKEELQREELLKENPDIRFKIDTDEIFKNINFKTEHNSFGKALWHFLKKYAFNPSDVYKRAGISKQYFNLALNDKVNPGKQKVMQICIGLKLRLFEANNLMYVAGYAFSDCYAIDLIFKYAIEKEMYDIHLINELLYEYSLKYNIKFESLV